ncbi:MAG: 3-phosphoserine/phosphohydroxythreonine transaminase [Myxococcota bacterium]
MARAHNFSAGPALLPLSVIEEIQQTLPELSHTGQGLMEISHRSAAFEAIRDSAEQRLRALLNVPDDYAVLFLQGGASMQFYQTGLNLLGPDDKADIIMTGRWSDKAIVEMRRCGDIAEAWAPDDGVYNRVPSDDQVQVREDAVYVHYTSNNTVHGTQFHQLPEAAGKPLVADMSSDICSRPIDVRRHAVIYAGAQKNLGPSGVTAVIVSPWALERASHADNTRSGGLPSMLDYRLMAKKDSMFNTPNTFGIFALDRVLAWVESRGGVDAMAEQNLAKAGLIYNELEQSDFWRIYAQKGSRSIMNPTWFTPTTDTDRLFVSQAAEAGLKALKGHRSVGGLRASIYNACPIESVEVLVDFMKDFEKRHG